jgi:hypothetical protein
MPGTMISMQINVPTLPTQTVSLWRRRFVAERLAGLQHQRHGSGR